jgi:hypothetical protein
MRLGDSNSSKSITKPGFESYKRFWTGNNRWRKVAAEDNGASMPGLATDQIKAILDLIDLI